MHNNWLYCIWRLACDSHGFCFSSVANRSCKNPIAFDLFLNWGKNGYFRFFGGKIIIHVTGRLVSTPVGNQSLISHPQLGWVSRFQFWFLILFCEVNVVNNSDSSIREVNALLVYCIVPSWLKKDERKSEHGWMSNYLGLNMSFIFFVVFVFAYLYFIFRYCLTYSWV